MHSPVKRGRCCSTALQGRACCSSLPARPVRRFFNSCTPLPVPVPVPLPLERARARALALPRSLALSLSRSLALSHSLSLSLSFTLALFPDGALCWMRATDGSHWMVLQSKPVQFLGRRRQGRPAADTRAQRRRAHAPLHRGRARRPRRRHSEPSGSFRLRACRRRRDPRLRGLEWPQGAAEGNSRAAQAGARSAGEHQQVSSARVSAAIGRPRVPAAGVRAGGAQGVARRAARADRNGAAVVLLGGPGALHSRLFLIKSLRCNVAVVLLGSPGALSAEQLSQHPSHCCLAVKPLFSCHTAVWLPQCYVAAVAVTVLLCCRHVIARPGVTAPLRRCSAVYLSLLSPCCSAVTASLRRSSARSAASCHTAVTLLSTAVAVTAVTLLSQLPQPSRSAAPRAATSQPAVPVQSAVADRSALSPSQRGTIAAALFCVVNGRPDAAARIASILPRVGDRAPQLAARGAPPSAAGERSDCGVCAGPGCCCFVWELGLRGR